MKHVIKYLLAMGDALAMTYKIQAENRALKKSK
jgi:hypothetical protein